MHAALATQDEATHQKLTEVWHRTNAQNGALVARAQAGVTSPAYEPGPYAPNEYQVDAFCTWYVRQLTEASARPWDERTSRCALGRES